MRSGEFKMLVAGLGVAALTLQGCGTYEDGPGISLRSKEGRLTGEWKLVSSLGSPVTDEVTVYEFADDGKYEYTSSYYDDFSEKDTTVSETGTWEWESGKESLKITTDGDASVLDIKRLTKDELTLSVDYFGISFEAEFEKQ